MKILFPLLRFVAMALFGLSIAGAALAQSYPSRAIRLVVPFPAGGGPADILARIIAQKMSENFGQQVIVDNRPGANTIIGAEAVAKAPPDGYTLLMAIDSTLTMNPTLYSKLPYDPIRDFDPVSLIAIVPTILVVSNNLPVNNVRELVALAKSKPGQIMFGSGTLATHLAGELFNNMTGTKMVNVPYKGASSSMTAILAGEVPVVFSGVSTALVNWKAGKVKALAAMGAKRLPQAPELPTVAESGVPGYEAEVWQSIVVPTGTPREIIAKLNAELTRIMKLPETRERLSVVGIEPTSSTPEELAVFIRSETTKWSKIIKDIGLKIE
ncbi:MAG: tripartite tricarboxylate transporter substrate binding protein [Sulfuricaulis sp.]|nr:tripartite tricarboxylate transporter substrate binding protein [Sulfuricaulis sp.]